MSVLSPIEFGDDRHIYHQIADQIRGLIRDGILVPGARVPSENEMVHVYGCARPTIRQARDLLEREGWIKTERGRGHSSLESHRVDSWLGLRLSEA